MSRLLPVNPVMYGANNGGHEDFEPKNNTTKMEIKSTPSQVFLNDYHRNTCSKSNLTHQAKQLLMRKYSKAETKCTLKEHRLIHSFIQY